MSVPICPRCKESLDRVERTEHHIIEYISTCGWTGVVDGVPTWDTDVREIDEVVGGPAEGYKDILACRFCQHPIGEDVAGLAEAVL